MELSRHLTYRSIKKGLIGGGPFFVESIRDHWISVDVWLQLLKTNMTIHLPLDFVLDEKALQEVVSKDPILKIVVDPNRNDVGLYRHYYNNGKKKTATL